MYNYRQIARRVQWLSMAMLPVMASCSDAASDIHGTSNDPSASSTADLSTSAIVRKDVRAGVDNYVSIPAPPDATCILRAKGAEQSAGLELFSTEEGTAAFYYKPQSAAGVDNYLVDCQEANGAASQYALALQATSDAQLATAPPPKGALRPALTGDPLALSQQELHARGYPTRPDPMADPNGYQRWLAGVTRPVTVIGASKMRKSRAKAWSFTPNWTGVQNSRAYSNSAYVDAFAYWYVPSVHFSPDHQWNELAEWVGLNSDSGSIWQAGVVSQGTYGNATTNLAWFEFIAANGACIPMIAYVDYQIPPADLFFTELSFGDANFQWAITGNDSTQYVWWYMEDVTSGWTTGWQGISIANMFAQWAPGVTYVSGIDGHHATWIFERVALDQGVYARLPNFNDSGPYMFSPQALDVHDWTFKNWAMRPNWRYYMKDSTTGHTLATCDYDSSLNINFHWFNYN
jgi:hypothetical protein